MRMEQNIPIFTKCKAFHHTATWGEGGRKGNRRGREKWCLKSWVDDEREKRRRGGSRDCEKRWLQGARKKEHGK